MALGVALSLAASVAQAETTLRVVMNSDLAILDPHWTSAFITRSHGYMIYDTLFAMDGAGVIRPQMVDSYTISADGRSYSFTLREGLLWHDGRKVTSEDCVASLERWSVNDALGKRLRAILDHYAIIDDRTFAMVLKEPASFVLAALGKPLGTVAFMMPKRVAATDAATQITETIGSGPFIFKRDEWRPGDKAIYVRFERYKPRSEPPSGLAGGKVVELDRVEWRSLHDHQQEVNALLQGEVDYLETPLHDLLPILRADPHIRLVNRNRFGNQLFFRPNWLHKPFDNAKIREALWYAFRQEDFLEAMIGDPAYYKPCRAYFGCGTEYGSEQGMAGVLGADVAKARQLLREGGYDGTPVVLMQPTDVYLFRNLADVAKAAMERVGFKVELLAMDAQTLFARRANRSPPAAGGWNGYLLSMPVPDVLDPLMTANLDASCERAAPGWPCDTEMERLRDAFARNSDPAERRALADAVQGRAREITTHIPLGQWYSVQAMRSNVDGMLDTIVTVFWSLHKS